MRFRRRPTDDTAAEADDVVTIATAPARRPVRIAGQVVRMRIMPVNGSPAFTATIDDDTGRADIVWTGRRSIGGIELGRRLVVEGVAVEVGQRLRFTNPRYTLR